MVESAWEWLTSVVKHGTHNQKTHGNRGSSTALFRRARAGGFTFHPTTRRYPHTGYAVAVPGNSLIAPAASFTAAHLVSYLDTHADAFDANPALHLGGWYDAANDEMVLDLVEVFTDREAAILAGQERDEQAIFDLENLEEIRTHGTGGRVDKHAAGQPGGHLAAPVVEDDDARAEGRLGREVPGSGEGDSAYEWLSKHGQKGTPNYPHPPRPGLTFTEFTTPGWSPTMTRDQAEVWAANSAIRQPLTFVGRNTSIASIKEGGFLGTDNPKVSAGRVWGNGIYLGMADLEEKRDQGSTPEQDTWNAEETRVVGGFYAERERQRRHLADKLARGELTQLEYFQRGEAYNDVANEQITAWRKANPYPPNLTTLTDPSIPFYAGLKRSKIEAPEWREWRLREDAWYSEGREERGPYPERPETEPFIPARPQAVLVRANITNPVIVNAAGEDDYHEILAQAIPDFESLWFAYKDEIYDRPGIHPTPNLSDFLQSLGYDALVITQYSADAATDDTEVPTQHFSTSVGGPQVIVFDPHNVTVISDESPRYMHEIFKHGSKGAPGYQLLHPNSAPRTYRPTLARGVVLRDLAPRYQHLDEMSDTYTVDVLVNEQISRTLEALGMGDDDLEAMTQAELAMVIAQVEQFLPPNPDDEDPVVAIPRPRPLHPGTTFRTPDGVVLTYYSPSHTETSYPNGALDTNTSAPGVLNVMRAVQGPNSAWTRDPHPLDPGTWMTSASTLTLREDGTIHFTYAIDGRSHEITDPDSVLAQMKIVHDPTKKWHKVNTTFESQSPLPGMPTPPPPPAPKPFHLTADMEDWFDEDGDMLPGVQKAIRDIYTLDHGGLKADQIMVDGDEYQVSVTGNIYPSGATTLDYSTRVGYFTRYLSRDGSIIHDMFTIDAAYRGQDFGDKFFAQSIEAYNKAGFSQVKVHANIDVGGYVWAMRGYEWDREESYGPSDSVFNRLSSAVVRQDHRRPEVTAYVHPDTNETLVFTNPVEGLGYHMDTSGTVDWFFNDLETASEKLNEPFRTELDDEMDPDDPDYDPDLDTPVWRAVPQAQPPVALSEAEIRASVESGSYDYIFNLTERREAMETAISRALERQRLLQDAWQVWEPLTIDIARDHLRAIVEVRNGDGDDYDLPTPYDIAVLGKNDPTARYAKAIPSPAGAPQKSIPMWPGKSIMLSTDWYGVLELDGGY